MMSCAVLQNYPTCDIDSKLTATPAPLAVQASLMCLPCKPQVSSPAAAAQPLPHHHPGLPLLPRCTDKVGKQGNQRHT